MPEASPFRLSTLAAFCLLLLVLLFEEIPPSIWYGAQALTLTFALCEAVLAQLRAQESRPWFKHWAALPVWQFLGLTLAMMLSACVMAYSTTQQAEPLLAVKSQLKAFLPAYLKDFAAILFFGLVYWNGRRLVNPSASAYGGLLRAFDALIWIWFCLALLSAAASGNPEISFSLLRKETGAYLILYMIALEVAHNERHWAAQVRTLAVLGLLISIVSTVFYYVYGGRIIDPANLELCDSMRRNGLVYHNTPYSLDFPWRAVWPTEHPNRLASLGIILTFTLFFCAATMRKRELQVLWAICAAVPAYLICITQTRGAMIGVALGLAALFALACWIIVMHQSRINKALAISLALLIGLTAAGGVYVALPQHTKERIDEVFTAEFWSWLDLENKTLAKQGQGTGFMRTQAWRGAFMMLEQYPWLGIGHGWERFEEEYILLKMEGKIQDLRENKPHAHMNLLETTVENGYAAGAAWLLLHLCFFIALAAAFFRARDPRRQLLLAIMLSLQLAIAGFGMTNFSLRYRAGMLIWIATAWAVAMIRNPEFGIREEIKDGIE
ncbi:O-antigen ligase family protein [Candidatus Sumerlaeota bacterium]|nr:O-antigen ligase family protein [Candidatus Sumerlaeota bacterium]